MRAGEDSMEHMELMMIFVRGAHKSGSGSVVDDFGDEFAGISGGAVFVRICVARKLPELRERAVRG